jgi:endonuclease/exonuclease/phosphatase family metal-dependent hydrolase
MVSQTHAASFLLLFGSFVACAAEDDFRDRIWRGSASTAGRESKEFKVLSWNIERGLQFDSVSEVLSRLAPDILLLQEVDLNARRSGSRDVPKELAERLGMNYAFAAEFVELGEGTAASPAYHGQAVLTSSRIRSATIIRFRRQSDYWRPRWFIPNWRVFQRRIGGRLALAAEIETGHGRLVVFNVHLESRGPEDLRLDQFKEVLEAATKYRDSPVIVAGDLNVDGPGSPVIRAAREAGFRTAVGDQVTTTRGAPLDYIFVLGDLGIEDGAVHSGILASDHFPLTVQINIR